jgi:hypothetical protein
MVFLTVIFTSMRSILGPKQFLILSINSIADKHLFLPKDYSGSPTSSIYTPWTDAEVLSHLTTGWGSDAITELKLEYLYRPEPEVSGE